MKKHFVRDTLAFFALLVLYAACDPLFTNIKDDHATLLTANKIVADSIQSGDTIKLMTWNIKFGAARMDYFEDCHGDYVHLFEDEIKHNLDQQIQFINNSQPDVLFVQEIDRSSKRSDYVNQLEYILNRTSLNYVYYAPEWKGDYIPVSGVGRINSGNAIFSKFPMRESSFQQLPQPSGLSSTDSYFYLQANICRAAIPLKNGNSLYVLNTRLSQAAHDSTKKHQVAILHDELKKLQSDGQPFILGACLNLLPPNSTKTMGFPDEACPDSTGNYSQQNWMDALYTNWKPAVELSKYQSANDAYFSYSRSKDHFWNKKVDYIFSNKTFLQGTDTTFQSEATGGVETMLLSDHAPICVSFVVP